MALAAKNVRGAAGGGLASFQISYQISPIIFVGGLAQNMSGGMAPIVNYLQGQSYDTGLLSQSDQTTIENFFAHFIVMSGGTLADFDIAKWPFASQAIAANSTIQNPLTVSLRMVCPARETYTYSDKISILSGLVSAIQQHNALGGYYNVATPSYIYEGCLLRGIRDITEWDEGSQVQTEWQWDFEKPLITAQQAQTVQNQAMSRVSNALQISGDPPTRSPLNTSVGQPSSNLAASLIPSALSPVASNVAPTNPVGDNNSSLNIPVPF